MALGKLSKTTDRMLAPLAKAIVRTGVTPNSITILGLAIVTCGGYFLYLGKLLIGIIFILVGAFADMLDGLVARYSSGTTAFGGFLDSLVDRYSDCIIFGSMILGNHIEKFFWFSGLFWGLAALAGALLTSYVRSLSESKGVSMKGIGLIERPERLLIFCIAGLLNYVTIGIVVLAILANFTVLQRIYHFYKTNKDK